MEEEQSPIADIHSLNPKHAKKKQPQLCRLLLSTLHTATTKSLPTALHSVTHHTVYMQEGLRRRLGEAPVKSH